MYSMTLRPQNIIWGDFRPERVMICKMGENMQNSSCRFAAISPDGYGRFCPDSAFLNLHPGDIFGQNMSDFLLLNSE